MEGVKDGVFSWGWLSGFEDIVSEIAERGRLCKENFGKDGWWILGVVEDFG
jgi:hypothetical protein